MRNWSSRAAAWCRAVFWLKASSFCFRIGPLPLANWSADGGRTRALRAAWGTRIGLPASEWMLEIGAWLMRTESELVLKSRRVVPGRLLAEGFQFLFPDWPTAARELEAFSQK